MMIRMMRWRLEEKNAAYVCHQFLEQAVYHVEDACELQPCEFFAFRIALREHIYESLLNKDRLMEAEIISELA